MARWASWLGLVLGAGFGGLHLGMHDGEADADTAGDFAQGLAFGAAGEDRAAHRLEREPEPHVLTAPLRDLRPGRV